ncbi:MAG: hypothetical protein HWD58_21820 [Bacteroidota bacterium]|nr:MAG: hypothetical protein HWD58_21820 [Bacteroidota bacterium]
MEHIEVADMANAYSLTSSYVTNELATLAQPPTNLIFANHSYGFPSSGTNSAYFDQVLVNAPIYSMLWPMEISGLMVIQIQKFNISRKELSSD